MNFFRAKVRFLAIPFILLTWLHGGFAQSQLVTLNNELESYQTNLAALEKLNGYSSPELVETLEQIADRHMALGDYHGAYVVYDRAQQIIRLDEGLFSTSQYPFLRKKIASLVQDGDWANSRKLQEYLLWLYTRNDVRLDEDIVGNLYKAAEVHLKGVVEDDSRYQAYHLQRSALLTSMALLVAKRYWQPDDLRHGQVFYQQVKQSYLQALAIEQRRGAELNLHSSFSNEPLVIDRDVARSMHRGNGYLFIERMRNLQLSRETPDLQAAAMTTLYRADLQILFGQQDEAVSSYAEAYDELIAAGIAKVLVDDLFAKPLLLPLPEFYSSVSEALAHRIAKTRLVPPLVHNGPVWLSFDQPDQLSDFPSFANQALTIVENEGDQRAEPLVYFRLGGVEHSPQNSLSHHRQNSLGVAYDFHVKSQTSLANQQLEAIAENFAWMRFRPKLVDGVPVSTTGLIGRAVVTTSLGSL